MKKIIQPILFIVLTLACMTSAAIQCENHPAALIIQPGASIKPLLKAIYSAHQHIRLTMYTFSDKPILRALIHQQKHGVKIQIILEKSPYTRKRFNQSIYRQLKHHHIAIRAGNPRFKFTHQKTLVIDRRQAFIMTGNFTPSGIYYQRNFYYITKDPSIINTLIQLFNADWHRQTFSLSHSPLILSPNNSETTLLALIKQTHHQLLIDAPGIDDYKIIDALIAKAHEGVSIIINSNQSILKSDKKYIHQLQLAGVKIRFKHPFNIHAKLIISDNKIAYLGSANLTYVSLTKNREVGILICNPGLLAQLVRTFSA